MNEGLGKDFYRKGNSVKRFVARGQTFMWCVRNPKNINIFVRVPGREDRVTGVTEKLFMCQMFMWWTLFGIPGRRTHAKAFMAQDRAVLRCYRLRYLLSRLNTSPKMCDSLLGT